MSEQAQESGSDEVMQAIGAIRYTLDSNNETMKTVRESLETIKAFGKRTRHISIALIFSLALDIMLTVVVGVISLDSVSQSNTIRMVEYSNCVSANQARTDQIHLWSFFISLVQETSSPGQSAVQRRRNQTAVSELNNFVRDTFALHKCTY